LGKINLFLLSSFFFFPSLLQKKAQIELQEVKEDREKFFGLGDCFCLTDPSLEDNPIVSASDGFIKVTGYSREEVIPHNCRFLQGSFPCYPIWLVSLSQQAKQFFQQRERTLKR